MSLPARVVHKRRATITDLPLYYSGHLLKKLPKEKAFNKYYGELRGTTLFLYQDDTQDTYTEKVDLEQLKSMELKFPYQKKAPTIFNLSLDKKELQLKKEIPSKLKLLPGQMLLLQDVLDRERRRNTHRQCPTLPPRPRFLPPASASLTTSEDELDRCAPEFPACFFSVSRQEAERMLEANPESGSIILRPSTLANNYALTLRQLTPSGPVMKNYRVTSTTDGFVIELDTASKDPWAGLASCILWAGLASCILWTGELYPPPHLSISSCSRHDISMAIRSCSSKLDAAPKCPDNRGLESGESAVGVGSDGDTAAGCSGAAAASSPSALPSEMVRDSWRALRRETD
ncbi:Signal-transducing adaptor protein 1 [Liparis tanakae]|uniref:Signal-transducing adaptor protein 1 n=1 Tax=Liparis tanakae TaxID=230148 RepID=A0A4Z2IWQ4_9TELE|nr:Signal-transducing adaptor protein 1 [Liparis tanakae]